MSARTLDPLVHGCSRRRARKLIRAARKHPVESIPWPHRAHVIDWLRQHPTVLTPKLLEALQAAFEIYPASRWLPCEFPEFAAAVARRVPTENLETWAWLRADGNLVISLRDCPKTSFPLPSVRVWDWNSRRAIRFAWRINAGKLIQDPRFAALSSEAQLWLIEVASVPSANPWPVLEALSEATSAALETIVECGGLWPSAIAKLPTPTACRLLRRWPHLRQVERKGARMAFEIALTHHAQISEWAPALFTRIGKARHNRQLWFEMTDALQLWDPAFVLSALTTRPDLLFEYAERLHAFGQVRAKALAKALRTHPLFTDPTNLIALDNLLTAHRDLARTLPQFQTWDLHWAGQKVISLPAIEGIGRQLKEGLVALRLRFLIQRVESEIALCGDAHAGLLSASLRCGRKPLTRFLQRYTNGDDPRLHHASNQRWLAARPDFPIETWLHPLKITLPVTGIGDVTLEVETNPFELLRLGTYAKSCLAAGACNSANAVAVLLDINKRVIYARTTTGRFLARQIVAISDKGDLVAHAVYPDSVPQPLEDFFQLFVEDWAMQMRLGLARGGHHPVAPLTIPFWYDDGLWHRYAVSA